MAETPFVVALEWIAHNPGATYYVMAIIAMVFAVLLAVFIVRLTVAERDVRGLIGFLTSGNIYTVLVVAVEGDRKAADRVVAEAGLDERSPIARRFVQYCAGLHAVEGTNSIPRSTRPASEIFEPDGIIREVLNLRLLQAIPNVLVGIGLLFTFLGLTAALYFASQGSDARNVAQTQASIRSLLDAAAFKFASSLTALLLSIVFLFIERVLLRRYQKHVLQLVSTLDNSFPIVTAEELLRSLLDSRHLRGSADALLSAAEVTLGNALDSERGSASAQLRAYLRDVHSTSRAVNEQTALLGDFGATIAETVSSALDATLGVRITTTFDRLNSTIANVGKNIQKANEDVLKRLLDDFTTTLESRTRESFDSVAASAREFSDLLARRTESLNVSFEGIALLTKDISQEGRNGLALLTRATTALDELVERTAAAVAAAAAAAEPLSEVTTSTSKMLQNLKTAQKQASQSIVQLTEAARAIREASDFARAANVETHDQLAARLSSSAGEYREALLETNAQIRESFRSISAEMGHLANDLRSTRQASDANQDSSSDLLGPDRPELPKPSLPVVERGERTSPVHSVDSVNGAS